MTKQKVIPGIYIDTRVATTPKGNIEYDLTSGSGPIVLSIHAGLGGADQGRLIADWLANNGYRILSPSRPGYLRTPLSNSTTFEEQADLLAALLAALHIKKVIVTTLSAGGPVAYTFAAKYPHLVSALVVISGVSGSHALPEDAGPIAQALFMSTPGQKIVGAFANLFPRAFLSGALSSLGYMTKQQRKAYVEYVLRTPSAFRFMKGLIDTMYPYSTRAQGNANDTKQLLSATPLPLTSVTCPTLIVHGTHDADVPFYNGVRAYEEIDGAERYWIEHGDHLAFWLSPESPKVQAYARTFLRRHIQD